jgi:hypothetical protein
VVTKTKKTLQEVMNDGRRICVTCAFKEHSQLMVRSVATSVLTVVLSNSISVALMRRHCHCSNHREFEQIGRVHCQW